ncbi:hypothetical protein [Streptomyces niveus]|uniref:hypothetical protein n=1 Tax=Streptomyces niveus TaxID=193462 RepID=UPI0036D40C59
MSASTLDHVLAGTPAAEFVAHLADYGDVQLFIGHIDEAEANRRLAATENDLSGLLTIQGPLRHTWVAFGRHEAGCRDASRCDCGEADWYPNPAEVDAPGAVAVTTGFADEEWWR